MGRELAEPDWLPLADDELLAILGRSDPGGLGRQPAATWRSPRPMSAAALVRHGDTTVFVKRHHVSVRTPEQLAAEHEFATTCAREGCRSRPWCRWQAVKAAAAARECRPCCGAGTSATRCTRPPAASTCTATRSAGRRTPAWDTRTRRAWRWPACTWPPRISRGPPGPPPC